MGCRFEFLLDPRSSSHDRFSVEAIADELVDLVQDWHNRLSVFSAGSVVSWINRQPAGCPVKIDKDLMELLRLCESIRIETGGAFNIAAGTLMRAHGFRDETTDLAGEPLDLDHAITLDTTAQTIARNDDRVYLDFGAIAKGYVLDLVVRELHDYGIEHAFVHGGTSSSIAIGSPEDSGSWMVRTSDSPKLDARISGFGLGISQTNAREIVTQDTGAIGHIMDTRTNQPAHHDIERAVCIHPSAAIADAYSTALSVNPELIDTLQDHGCSIAVFPTASSSTAPILRDRLGLFITDPDEPNRECIF